MKPMNLKTIAVLAALASPATAQSSLIEFQACHLDALGINDLKLRTKEEEETVEKLREKTKKTAKNFI
ncbi:MAG: hypothetical protein GDA53_08650 [Rhodobacteraceae bacterium]|nr:hypothetical protein [Paracoccaceae bacterium]